MTDIFEDLDALTAEMEVFRTEYRRKGEAKLRDAFRAFLDAYPQVHSLTVVGLVPYFNDGDPCEFYIRDVYLTGSSRPADADPASPEDDSDYDTCLYDDAWIGDMPEEIDSARRRLSRILHNMEDVLQAVFGSHFIVTVTRDKLVIEEYTDHD